MSLGSMALIAAVFTLSATTSENLDSRSTSVSIPLHDCHLELIHVLGTLWRFEPRHRRSLFHTDLGLNHCVTACQVWSPSPGLTLRILLTSVATSPWVHVIRAAAIVALNCWTFQKLLPRFQSCCLRTFPVWQLLSTAHHPVHRATGLPHSPPSETQSHRSQVGFHRIAAVSVSQPPCGSVSGRAAGLNLTWL